MWQLYLKQVLLTVTSQEVWKRTATSWQYDLCHTMISSGRDLSDADFQHLCDNKCTGITSCQRIEVQ